MDNQSNPLLDISDQVRLLVCTANLGNAPPDLESLTSWIPRDGICNEVIRSNPKYPVVMMEEKEQSEFGVGESLENNPGSTLDYMDNDSSSYDSTERPLNAADEAALDVDRQEEKTEETDSERVKVSREKRGRMARSLAIWAKELNTKVGGVRRSPKQNKLQQQDKEEESESTRQDQTDIDEFDQFDLIVIGMQEATFGPPSANSARCISANTVVGATKLEDTSESEPEDSVRVRLPTVKPITRRVGNGVEQVGKRFGKGAQKIARLTQDRDYTKQHLALTRRDWGGGSACLHAMLDAQLPSYERIVSYQRGQMRLEVYCNTYKVEVEVLHTEACNTGKAGLANKGGIVTELLINGTTKISFLNAHLEAHEGHSKFLARCSSLGDILGGTKSSKYHDVSTTSHFSFVMGDLNFRTELDARLPKDAHKRAIQVMVEKENWEGLNNADELHRALRQKLCLRRYVTPRCNFPPTFKTVVQRGFQWQEKRRPSYCDRVLWKTAPELESAISPLVYEPIGEFATSDHKPIRAAFSVELNGPFRVRPKTPRHRATFRFGKSGRGSPLSRQPANESQLEQAKMQEKVQLFLSNVSVEIFNKDSLPPNPYVSLISYPEEALKSKMKGRWTKVFPWIGQRKDGKGKLRMKGWPSTSRKFSTFSPNWVGEEQVECTVKLAHSDGSPVDLTGALLHLTVLDFNPAMEDSVIGTHTINMIPLLSQCRNQAYGVTQRLAAERDASNVRSVGRSFMFRFRKSQSTNNSPQTPPQTLALSHTTSADDPIVEIEIDEALIKNGREVGKIRCKLEAWWINSATANIFGAAKSYKSAPGHRRTLSGVAGTKQRSAHAIRRSNLVPVRESESIGGG